MDDHAVPATYRRQHLLAPACYCTSSTLVRLPGSQSATTYYSGTFSVLNYKTFEFFYIKFNYLFYSKICAKYHLSAMPCMCDWPAGEPRTDKGSIAIDRAS
jgi:hypothetical protein